MVIDIVVLSIVILVLIISLVTSYMALSNLQQQKNFATNVDLQSAKTYLWATIGLSVIAFLMVVALMIMTFVYKDKVYSKPHKYVIIGLSVAAWLFILIAGITSAIAANKIRGQNISDNWSIASAVFLLLIGNLAMIGYSIYVSVRKPSLLKTLKEFSVKDKAKAGLDSAKRLFGVDRRSTDVPDLPAPSRREYGPSPRRVKQDTGFTRALNETFG